MQYAAPRCIKSVLLIQLLLLTSLLFGQVPVPEYTFEDSILVVGERDEGIPKYNTIATKLPISLRQTPAIIGIVTRRDIETNGGVNLEDVLPGVSGLNVQSNFGVHDYFLIRGFNSLDNGLILVDGTVEPEASFTNLYNIDRLEVLKGPAFLYGGNPLSGTVNLIKKRAVFKNHVSLSGRGGQYGSLGATLDAGAVNGIKNLSGRLNGVYQKSDGFRDGKQSTVSGINPTATYRPNNNTLLTADYEYLRSEYTPDAGVPVIDGRFFAFASGGSSDFHLLDDLRETSYDRESDFSDQKMQRAMFSLKHRVSDSFTLRNQFYFKHLDWQSQGTLINASFANAFLPLTVSKTNSSLLDVQEIFGNQLEGIATFNTANVSHQVLLGVEYVSHKDDFILLYERGGFVNAFDPTQKVVIPSRPVISDTLFLSVADAKSISFAPYFLNRISFSSQFQLFLGARYDMIDYEDEKFEVLYEGDPGLLFPNSREYVNLSPNAGAVYSPTEQTSFYANWATAFAPPSSQVSGVPKPEESWQVEVGYKQSFLNDKAELTLAGFQIQKENVSITGADGRSQNGRQRSRGGELELKALPLRNLFISFAYSYTEAELLDYNEFNLFTNSLVFSEDTTTTAPFSPKHIAHLLVDKRFDIGLGLSMSGRYTDSQTIAVARPGQVYEIDSHIRVDGSIFFDQSNWRASINLQNLTGETYETRGFGATSVIPAPKFAAFGSLTLRL